MKTLKELKAVHGSSLIILVENDYLKIYGDDCRIIEYISNYISNDEVIIFKYKKLNKIKKLLKSKNINFVLLDGYDYKTIYSYQSDKNNYEKYYKKSKKYNKIRRKIIMFYNYIFNVK